MVSPSVLVIGASSAGANLSGASLAAKVFRYCLLAMYAGLALDAVGDTYKSASKAFRGEAALVTGGPFYFLRHPNYTGEQLLWTANFISGIAAVAAVGTRHAWISVGGWLMASALGLSGIMFVLMQATGGLEAKQKEAYSADPVYQKWVAHSWKGLALARKATAPASPAIEEQGSAAAEEDQQKALAEDRQKEKEERRQQEQQKKESEQKKQEEERPKEQKTEKQQIQNERTGRQEELRRQEEQIRLANQKVEEKRRREQEQDGLELRSKNE